MKQLGSAWCKIIDAITAPLGFFVLALLIVETFLATVLVGGNLDRGDQVMGMWLGVGLFVLVNIIVFVLVWYKAENLTFDKEAHLRSKATFGTNSNPSVNRDAQFPTTASRGDQ